MLPGGQQILGLYLYTSPGAVQRLQGHIRQLAHRLCSSNTLDPLVRRWVIGTSLAAALTGNAVIIQVCSSSKKTSVRTLDTSDHQAQLKPAEMKFQSFLRHWTAVSCTYSFDEHIYADKSFSDVSPAVSLPSKLGQVALQLDQASAAIVSDRGRFFRKPEEPLVPKTSGQSSRSPLQLEFWAGFAGEDDSISVEELQCQARLSGTVCGRAYMYDRATFQEACGVMKLDILRSLSARLQLLSEDVQETTPETKPADQKSQETKNPSCLACPQRCFMSVGTSGQITACDYAFADEEPAACVQRVEDMLGVPVKEGSCSHPETLPVLVDVVKDLWTVPSPSTICCPSEKQEEASSSQPRPQLSTCTTVVGAVLAAALAGICSVAFSMYN